MDINIYLNYIQESSIKVPNILYFGSPKKLKELKGQVFLSPYIGIASMFTINKKDIKSIYGYSCNLDYLEWNNKDKDLLKPLKFVHITHNIKEVTKKENGVSSGYIYKIDITNFKDKLSLFYATKDPNREVIYKGKEPLPILKIIPIKVKWNCEFSKENAKQFGYAKRVK